MAGSLSVFCLTLHSWQQCVRRREFFVLVAVRVQVAPQSLTSSRAVRVR